MEYKRLTKREESGAVTYDNGNGYYHTIYSGNDGHAVHALAWKLAELEDKIEKGTLIELPRVLRYVDYEYAIEKFVVQWQENERIKQKSYFSEKKAYHRLKELQE